MRTQDLPSVIIIGAGISGILMAIKLMERGYCDIIILEKCDRLGGTWRDNSYPGVACDVAAHLYTYSFARNPWWKTRYAKGKDIWAYYHGVAQRHGVLPLIQYGKEVATADFDGRHRRCRQRPAAPPQAAGDSRTGDVRGCYIPYLAMGP